VRRAGSLETENVRAALAALQAETPLGRYRVGASGQQLGIVPAVAQIQRGRAQVVWPFGFETAQPLQPYPQWSDRKVLE